MSLRYIHLTLKHKQPRLSTGLTVKMYTEIQGEITFRFVKQCALTIFVVRAKVGSHRKYHRTAVTKTVRQSELPESQHLVRAGTADPEGWFLSRSWQRSAASSNGTRFPPLPG